MNPILSRNKSYFISSNFFYIFIANFISSLGDYIYQVGIIVYLYNETKSAPIIGGYFIIQFVSSLALTPIIGTLIDRWNKKYILLFTNIIRAVALGLLLINTSTVIIYIVAVAIGVNEEIFGATQNSIIPEIVEDKQVIKANSLISTSDSINMIIGPALAGILISTFEIYGSIITNAISFLFASLFILFIKMETNILDEDKTQNGSFLTELKDGFLFIVKNSLVKRIILIWGLLLIGVGATGALVIFLLSDYLKLPSDSYGWAMTAEGLGIVLGSLMILKFKDKFTFTKLIRLGLLLIGGSLTIISISNNYYILIIFYCFAGLGASAAPLGLRSTLQTQLPKKILGRVFMSVRFIVTSLRTFSIAGATLLVNYINLKIVFFALSIIIIFAFLLSLLFKFENVENVPFDENIKSSTST